VGKKFQSKKAMPERRGGAGHKWYVRLKQYSDTPMMKHRREEKWSVIFTRRSRI